MKAIHEKAENPVLLTNLQIVSYQGNCEITGSEEIKKMRKTLIYIFLPFIFLISFAIRVSAQPVETTIGNAKICPGTFISMPIVVKNMIGIDSLKLMLGFDSQSVLYSSYFAVHSEVSGSNFNIINLTDSICIFWKSKSDTVTASILNDTLVWITFKGISDSTNLKWIQGSSFYHSASLGFLGITFFDGKAKVDPAINILLTEIDPTCTAKCEANYMVNTTGGIKPYTIRWNGQPGRFDSIQTNLCAGSNLISIKDSWGCLLDSLFTIDGLPGADIELLIVDENDKKIEDETIYLQNPVLTFSFTEKAPTHIVNPPLWEFGDGDTAREFHPTHLYSRADENLLGFYLLKLYIQNENGCDTLIEKQIPIKDVNLENQKLKIPNALVMNGTIDANRKFSILNVDNLSGTEVDKAFIDREFEHMEIYIFDRWGRKIYADSNYQSDWTADGVPDGVYYYVLKTIGYYKTEKYRGSITIFGSGVK